MLPNEPQTLVYGIGQELITMKTVDLSIRDVAHYIWDGSGPDFVHSLLITEQPVSFMAFLCSCASVLNTWATVAS